MLCSSTDAALTSVSLTRTYVPSLDPFSVSRKLINGSQPDGVYFHSDREDVTYRIWQLLDTQKKQLLDFILAEPDSVPSPFPILADENNLKRIDPEEPMSETGIYRDLWERKPLGDGDVDSRSHCCAYNDLDYPSMADYKRSKQRCWDRQTAEELREAEERQARRRGLGAQGPLKAAPEGEEDASGKSVEQLGSQWKE